MLAGSGMRDKVVPGGHSQRGCKPTDNDQGNVAVSMIGSTKVSVYLLGDLTRIEAL